MSEPTWRKSSYSGGNDGDCVEVAWRKSSYSGTNEGSDCVEVAFPGDVAVRDSKAPSDGQLSVAAPAWRAFVERLTD